VVWYYALDLSREPNPVLSRFSAWSASGLHSQSLTLYRGDPAGDSCGALFAMSSTGDGSARRNHTELELLLEPERYLLAFEPNDVEPASHAALDIELDRSTCRGGPVAGGCEAALDIDTSLEWQIIEGNTACGANQLTVVPCSDEGEDAPEQLYRLDLRGGGAPTQARLTILADGLGFPPILYVLAPDANGGCGEALYCDDRIDIAEGPPRTRLLLQPELYFVGVDGAELGSSGAFRMLVELAPGVASPCVTSAVEDCMFLDGQADCCSDWTPLCSRMVGLCGLDPATQACVCEADPACCGLAVPESCAAVQSACNYLCPEFAPSEFTCLGALP
jgi:hypothetical protein